MRLLLRILVLWLVLDDADRGVSDELSVRFFDVAGRADVGGVVDQAAGLRVVQVQQLGAAALALVVVSDLIAAGRHQHEAALGALALTREVHLLELLLLSSRLHHYRVGVCVADDYFPIVLHFLFTLLLQRRVMLLFNIILVAIE